MTSASDHPRRRWNLPPARHLAGLCGIVISVIVADQVSKAWIRSFLHPGGTWPEGWELIRLSHVHNTGAAFGILQGAGTFLVVAPLIAVAVITLVLLMLPAHNRWYSVALAAILGGAIGNLIDRVRLGYVTDFIDPMSYPSFNIADSAIVLGVIGIVLLSFFATEEPEDDPEPDRGDAHPEEARRSEART